MLHCAENRGRSFCGPHRQDQAKTGAYQAKNSIMVAKMVEYLGDNYFSRPFVAHMLAGIQYALGDLTADDRLETLWIGSRDQSRHRHWRSVCVTRENIPL